MIIIEFGASEQTSLDKNSLFITFIGSNFKENVEKIKKYWVKAYLKNTKEWEVPFSCWNDIKEMFKGQDIRYKNEPPKAKFVTENELLNGIDFNGYDLYDYQLEGVKFGLNHNNFLLLDEQRITARHYKP